MIALGIDPGIEKTGIGVVEQNGSKLSLVYHKLIHTSSREKDSARLASIFEEINVIIKMFKIDFASVEKLFFAKNVKTAFRVSEVRGVILLALEQNGIDVYEYTPLQVKQGLVGYGRGSKKQVQDLVQVVLGLKDKIIQDDVADGIACAIVGLNTYKTMSKIKENRL